MDNAQLLDVRTQATPGPWTRPDIDIHGGRITSPNAPEAPDRLRNNAERAMLDHTVALCKTDALADFIVGFHTNLDQLTSGNVQPAIWEQLRQLLNNSHQSLPGCTDVLLLDQAKLSHDSDDNGAFTITAPAAVAGHALHRKVLITVRHADGTDAEDDARLILGLLLAGRRLLTESCPYTARTINGVEIVLDTEDADLFDQGDWPPHNGDILDRKGNRLADLLADTDGIWRRAMPQVADGDLLPGGALDFRRHRLLTRHMSRTQAIQVPDQLWSQIKAKADKAGQDVGRYIAETLR